VKRNIGMHTTAQEAKLRMLQSMQNDDRGALKSRLARVAYPEYDFRSPQGAAFSIARIVSEMSQDGLVRYDERGHVVITEKGRRLVAEATAQTTQTGPCL
jgi:ribosomal protein S19E (S16A)